MNKQLWKKAFSRALIGMPIGLAISTVITIIISLCRADGQYYPVVPALVADCGSEINAVLIQALCSFLYGAIFAGASVVFETDWSLTKMTVVHLIAISLAVLPIAYFMQWMAHTFVGFLIYIGIFLLIYAIIWLINYRKIRTGVDAINQKIKTTL